MSQQWRAVGDCVRLDRPGARTHTSRTGFFIVHYKAWCVTGEFYRTRLSRRHLILTSYSKMSVKLAAQTLSEKVARSMEEYPHEGKREEMAETAKYIRTMDRWFDCMNTRLGNGKPTIKAFRLLELCYSNMFAFGEQKASFFMVLFLGSNASIVFFSCLNPSNQKKSLSSLYSR